MSRIIVETALGLERYREYAEALPYTFDSIGKTIFRGRNILKSDIAEGRQVVVKFFGYDNTLKKIINRFRIGKAEKSFRNAVHLQKLGVSTPGPVAYTEDKSPAGFRLRQYYVCDYSAAEAIAGEVSDPVNYNPGFMKALARFIAGLHSKGILHKDLNNTNIRYDREGADYRFSLIDINRMRFAGNGGLTVAERLDNLVYFSGQTDGFGFFVRAYLEASGLPSGLYERAMKVKRRHDSAYGRKKRFTRMFRKKRR